MMMIVMMIFNNNNWPVEYDLLYGIASPMLKAIKLSMGFYIMFSITDGS